MPDEITFPSHGVRCSAWHLPAQSQDLTTSRGRPCVVMGHGFGATKDAGLLPFAHRFAAVEDFGAAPAQIVMTGDIADLGQHPPAALAACAGCRHHDNPNISDIGQGGEASRLTALLCEGLDGHDSESESEEQE